MKKLLFYLVVAIFVATSINFVRVVPRLWETARELKGLEDQLRELEHENKRLNASLKEVESDEFVEREVRDKLGWGREGETVVVMPRLESNNEVTNEKEIEKEMKNWEKWLAVWVKK